MDPSSSVASYRGPVRGHRGVVRAFQVRDWSGELRVRSRSASNVANGVEIEHRRGPQVALWVETHGKRRRAWWERVFSRARPDELPHFCRRVLGHGLHHLAPDGTDERSRDARQEVLDLAGRLDDGQVWRDTAVAVEGSPVDAKVHEFADGAWVLVAESDGEFLGLRATVDGPTLDSMRLMAVDV